MEGPPSSRNPQKRYEHPQLGSFEVVELNAIKGSDVESGDRGFIHTESGNRYMLRHSKSRGGALIIYSERDGGFEDGTGHPFGIRKEATAIATVGRPLEYFEITDETSGRGSVVTSTNVTRIEVRKGFEAAIEKAVHEQAQGPQPINPGQMLREAVRGRRPEPPKKS